MAKVVISKATLRTQEANESAQKTVVESNPVAAAPRILDLPSSHSNNTVLDGFGNQKSLLTVLNRVSVASLTYAAGSSMFIYALLTAFNVHMYGWGPLQMAAANVVFVVYFTTIMVPFAMLLAWVFRYKKFLPYQVHVVDLKMSPSNAYELALGGALSVSGTTLSDADEKNGDIRCLAPSRQESAAQEIRVQVKALSSDTTRLTVSSQPMLNAIEYLLFGFTLAVDGGRNKNNVDQVVSFLNNAKLTLNAEQS